MTENPEGSLTVFFSVSTIAEEATESNDDEERYH
jgi:hypothetical protein